MTASDYILKLDALPPSSSIQNVQLTKTVYTLPPICHHYHYYHLWTLTAVHPLVQEQQRKTVPILWHHCCPSAQNKIRSWQIVRVETQINLLHISWVMVTTGVLFTTLTQVLQPRSPQFLSTWLKWSSPGICCWVGRLEVCRRMLRALKCQTAICRATISQFLDHCFLSTRRGLMQSDYKLKNTLRLPWLLFGNDLNWNNEKENTF